MLGDILIPRHVSASKNFFLSPVSNITCCSATCISKCNDSSRCNKTVILHVIINHTNVVSICVVVPNSKCVYVEGNG